MSFICIIGVKFECINHLIRTYNERCNGKFPLKPNGIYESLIYLLEDADVIESHYEEFKELIRYIRSVYQDEFDINYKMDNYIHEGTIIEALLSTQKIMNLVYFLLEEFKDELNLNDPCLISHCLRDHRVELFKYLVMNYKTYYSLDKICQIMSKFDGGPQDKKFLKSIQAFLLSSICENDKDKN